MEDMAMGFITPFLNTHSSLPDAKPSKNSFRGFEIRSCEVSVTETILEKKVLWKHSTFLLSLKATFKRLALDDWSEAMSVSRSESDFKVLRNSLMERFSGSLVPPTPITDPQLMHHCSFAQSASVVNTDANLFVRTLLNHPEMRHDDEVKAFLLADQEEWATHWKRAPLPISKKVAECARASQTSLVVCVSGNQESNEEVQYSGRSEENAFLRRCHQQLVEFKSKLETLLHCELAALSNHELHLVGGRAIVINSEKSFKAGNLYSALSSLIKKSFGDLDSKPEVYLSKLGTSEGHGQHDILLSLYIETSRCSRWIDAALETLLAGEAHLQRISDSIQKKDDAQASLRKRSAQEDLLDQAEDELYNTKTSLSSVLVLGRTWYHGVQTSRKASAADVVECARMIPEARRGYEVWESRAVHDIPSMLEALPVAVQQMTLRFVDIERKRFLHQAAMAQGIISDLRGPYVRNVIDLRQSQPIHLYPIERTTPEKDNQNGGVSEGVVPEEGMRQEMLLISDGKDIFFDNIYARLLCAPTEDIFTQQFAPDFAEFR